MLRQNRSTMSVRLIQVLLEALGETALMVFSSGAIGFLFGIPVGVLLFLTRPGQIKEHRVLNRTFGTLVNVGRSVPFIILLVAILPLTRLLTGTSIGTLAAIVPLSVQAIPFIARQVEWALLEVPTSSVEAALTLGAKTSHVIWRVLLPEALPGILSSATITLIALVGYSAMAGVVGGGGLGDIGIRYGYQRFDTAVMTTVVVVLVLLVQAIQIVGERAVRVIDHRN
jgi:D-methionine transport system permease protein